MNIKHENHTHYSTKKNPKQILQTKHIHVFTTKLRRRPFDSAGEGAVYVESESFAGDNIYFSPFILRYSLFESDGCRIIYLFS